MTYQPHLRQLCLLLLQCAVLSFSLLTISRGLFFLHIRDVLPLYNINDDIWRAFWIGGRIDAKVTAIAYAPLLLSGLISAAFQRAYHHWLSFALGYHSVIVFLYVLGSISNYYYYLTYGSYLDLFIFGLRDDNTRGILVSLWRDYPIITAIFASLLAGALAYLSSRRLLRRTLHPSRIRTNNNRSVTVIIILLAVLSTFVVARGSLSSLPLKRYHANVSPYKPLNIITPNAFMALYWATTDYLGRKHFEPVSQRQLTASMEQILGQPTPQYHTPVNAYLQDNPPNVVIAMMESMGMNILVEDNPQTNDLLGSLRPYWQQGFLFERFMAGTSATISSIVMTLFQSPVSTISHSAVQNIPLPSSAVLPYKRAGYRIAFLYGGNGMWRNLANYLPVQGFDRVYDENDIIEAFPEAEQYSETWGVPDGYLFRFANKVLEEAKQPTLLFIMSVTNHSPYKVPANYQPRPTTMTPRLNALIGYQGSQADVLLNTFQYAADALGQFIGRVKQSDQLKNNTIIAVTGDHRMRYSSTDQPTEYGLSFSVPFFLDIPSPILEHTPYKYDPQRIGSHRDLFPTLYHFSLSDRDYISLGGENMLSVDDIRNLGYNNVRSISLYGASSNDGSGLFYRWDKNNPLFNLPNPEISSPYFAGWGKAYADLQDQYLRSQILPTTP